jgi:hypothetical protein
MSVREFKKMSLPFWIVGHTETADLDVHRSCDDLQFERSPGCDETMLADAVSRRNQFELNKQQQGTTRNRQSTSRGERRRTIGNRQCAGEVRG